MTMQARVNGRSIEIYDEAMSKKIAAPLAPGDIEDLEGIGKAVSENLNQHKAFTFNRLTNTNHPDISTGLDAVGSK